MHMKRKNTMSAGSIWLHDALRPDRIEAMMLTYKYRVKDASTKRWLRRYAWASNQVWNYCNQIQREAETRWKAGRASRWPSAFDLIKLCTGSGADLGLHSDTVQTICREYAAKRDANRGHLRWRASGGPKRSLGWVPFIPRAIKVDGDCVRYLKRNFRFWKSREIGGVIKAGAFVEDARGRWYVCFQCDVADDLPTGTGEIGIDLGLKTLAVCTDGTDVPALRHYRRYEAQLAVAQRAKNKRRVRSIHAKIANARRHHLHEASTKIARENALIVVGNVNAAKLAKTRMAKSVLDASWSMFRNMLEYKARRHRARFIEADERWTSRTCSNCGTIPDSSPKGMGALGVRHWVCSGCGCSHDRDVNAARNILRVGAERRPPAVEIPVL
jgi:IS605 OrfB family transposase